ncbi:thymidylate synthase [candidate division WWE3 bacterium RIFCSPHIGHO2_01_FULL_48_15]|uniref:Thymidylate synthase n=1 Tax=candidate division WWE3 bacterium RIFCSPHIGHO2_01_FULL_48_15 TaxID=1802619 RepID=A0A1F4VAL3_UNCKA|nr:MAG: thymidylate synthase [candidate division WWE3 bacterium RIFCSPHIGHO2_01_FULL_48_15]
MRKVEPKVFLVGETRVVEKGLQSYLAHLGVPDWVSDAPTDAERLIEVMGRLCYRSFKPGLNPNVTKIREHNKDYIENINKVRHGSVIEHAMANFVFADVSRVFTHELVRHRVGTAMSQESLRFVRLDDLGQWLPTVIREDQEAVEIFARTFQELEQLQVALAEHFQLDAPGVPFHRKKLITSAMRRIAPDGLATTIGWSANMRTIRWLLEARTDPGAEEEIRLVFGKVGEIVVTRYPHLFSDFTADVVEGLPHYKPAYSKV